MLPKSFLDRDQPSVVLSFDFEMRWGVHHLYGLEIDAYRENLENCRPAVLGMLTFLEERGLRATWATVGALGLNSWDEYFTLAPPPPRYINSIFAIKRKYAEIDPAGKLHFAPDLITKIINTKGQELGSHSFSHILFGEPGVTANDLLVDLTAVNNLFLNKFGKEPTSLVYPCNQYKFTDLLSQVGIKQWRGPEIGWFFDCNSQKENTLLPRALRLVDSVNPFSSRDSYPEGEMLRASLFVRFTLPEPLWSLHLAVIKNELSNLKSGSVIHLWWHPHNLGFNLSQRLKRASQLFDLIAELCQRSKLVSKNMSDFLPNKAPDEA